jgi:hypothetical protein
MNYSEKYAASDAKLSELWQNLGSLNEAQWASLYQEVVQILQRCQFPELVSLPDTKEDYIQSFFLEKILKRTPSQDQGAIHAGFIRLSFRNYLRDELRRPANRDRVYLDASDDDQPDESSQLDRLHQLQGDKGGENAATTVDMEHVLAEHGLSIEKVQDSAFSWLRAQEEWAQQYLSVHFCPDHHDSPPSLQNLAAKLGIASYHYRARQLGITNKKTDLPSDFRKTAIGRWAIGLGIEIVPENMSVLLFLFKSLCLATLSLQGL